VNKKITVRRFRFEGDFDVELHVSVRQSSELHVGERSLSKVRHHPSNHQDGGDVHRLVIVAGRADVGTGVFRTHFRNGQFSLKVNN
jgi:hypothetical protein